MKRSKLESIIEEEIYAYLNKLSEKSVPEPYNRKEARRMTPAQIKVRDKIGKQFKKSEKTKKYFQKKFGDEWIDYLWATATNAAMDGSTDAISYLDSKKKNKKES